MGRITEAFDRLKRERHKGFIPFITAGDPDLDKTCSLLQELEHAGATLVELGVPFSDPMADGPVIQRASERALRHGFGISEVLDVVKRARLEVPVVLFSYFNPLFRFGIERLCKESRAAGIDGVLITDLAPEEALDVSPIFRAYDRDLIFLVAPTSTDTRLQMIAEQASGFIYAVSHAGVTGVRSEMSADAEKLVKRLRRFTDLPIAVGFGISSRAQIADVWTYADAAVVGSAIVAEVQKHGLRGDMVSRVGQFARGLVSSGND